MKHKFLITNDIRLALDKINEVVNMISSEDGFSWADLYQVDDLLIETLEHLAQAFDNVEENDNDWFI